MKKYLLIICIFLTAMCFTANTTHALYSISENPVLGLYKDDGPFVTLAPNFAANVFQLGWVGATVPCSLSFAILYSPFSEYTFSTVFDRGVNYSNYFAMYYARLIVYYPVGLPFFVIKKTFWDGPKLLIHWIFDLKEKDRYEGFEERTWERPPAGLEYLEQDEQIYKKKKKSSENEEEMEKEVLQNTGD